MPGLKRDKITSYRLSQTVVQEYLESLFGMYDFKIRLKSDHWVFYIPRKLTTVFMPTFLDFLFPFGKQLYTQDFQFSGFRSEDRLSSDDRGLELPRLGRSGRDIRMCYNLKSVEPSKSQKEWPWSIRQTAAYHSFDIETGKAFWVIIKGDQLIKRRIESTTNARRAQALNLSDFDSLATSFSSTLQAHLLIFDWCHEHWRWYINFLEQELQRLTRETLLVDLGQSSNVIDRTSSQGQRATSSQVHSSPLSVSEKATWRSGSEIKEPTSYPRPQYQAPPVPRPASLFAESQESLNADENFSFSDLQQVQSLEEKANEIILVLDSNASTLSKVKQYYRETFTFDEFPITLKSACARDFTKFEKAVGNIIGDLQMQESRTKMLLRLLTNRKSLLYGILDYRNMESNKLFASKAQLSTANMEIMTQGMHEIAQKTKQETVSMRIITLVTLFFLPGTFISTIMSTDIIQYQVSADGKSQEVFQLGALQLYLAITLPMMLLTFASWYGVYIWVDRKEKAKVIKMHLRALS
ncbi:hypothetical protein OIDMADRAFT_130241 [Oidiodendron maius Zn]|uniref:CorA-like transporter domain-containing protein n=1 Tax=Oidiodendron maius (strain Zn) TaxID=913774 RepID=A0A0C3H1K5_OIDMZ|nr:hypothetical protein OIDMADRAFT_130241 [Oidiodendron maius Zn]